MSLCNYLQEKNQNIWDTIPSTFNMDNRQFEGQLWFFSFDMFILMYLTWLGKRLFNLLFQYLVSVCYKLNKHYVKQRKKQIQGVTLLHWASEWEEIEEALQCPVYCHWHIILSILLRNLFLYLYISFILSLYKFYHLFTYLFHD